jgi:hypothetical protein
MYSAYLAITNRAAPAPTRLYSGAAITEEGGIRAQTPPTVDSSLRERFTSYNVRKVRTLANFFFAVLL